MDVGLSTRSLRPVMDIIAQRGWVVESEWGWVLSKAPNAIVLADVHHAWLRDTSPDGSKQVQSTTALQRRIEDGLRATLDGTLRDLLETDGLEVNEETSTRL